MAATIKYNPKKRTFTGTSENDVLDATTLDYVVPVSGKNKAKGLTIKGVKGNDIITGTAGNDIITGGVGSNVVNYTKGDGNDTIYLTKGENFTLNMKNLTLNDLRFEYANKNKDLRIYTSKTSNEEYITLKNFAKKDVTNNSNAKKGIADTSSVELVVGGKTYDLRTSKNITDNEDVVLYKTTLGENAKNFTGTWLNDEIDASNVKLYKKVKDGKKKVSVEKEFKDTGLTLKGGVGNDSVTGTKYSDKIYGNKGNDTINTGTGNNYIYFSKGDGNDIIENGNGIDTLVFAKKTQLSYSYDKYDLIIKYSDNDTVTLKDYLKGHSVQYVQIGKTKTVFNPPQPTVEEYQEDGYTVFNGSEIADTITGTNNNDNIYGNDGNDNIDAKKGADTIDGGIGNNTYTFVSGDGQDTIINGDGNDTIKFPDAQNITYSRILDGNDLIIGYGDNDSITLTDYFVDNSHSTKTILNGTTELNISEEVAKGYNLLGTESAETFNGTLDIPFTYVVNGGNDIIQNSKNTDTIKINTQETISYSKLSNSDDLVITYGDHNITIKGYFENNSSVQRLLNGTKELNIADEIKKNIDIYSNGYDDTINFSEPQNLSYSRYLDSNDLVINYGNESKITLKDFFINNYHSVQKIINGDETLYIKDINATFYFNDDQTLKIYKSPNEFDLCIDVEIIKNEEKNISTYILRNFLTGNNVIKNIKHGNDIFDLNTIIDYDTTCIISGGNNTFSGGCIIKGDPSDIIDAYHYPAYMSGYDLILGGLTLKNYFKNDEYPIDTIIRYYNEHSGSEWIATSENISLKEYLSYMTIRTDVGENTNDILPGKEKCNIFYYFKEGDGDDTILNYDGYSNLLFDPGTNIKPVKGLNNDLVLIYSDRDSVTLKDFFKGKDFPKDYYIYGNYYGNFSGSGPVHMDRLHYYGTDKDDTIILDKDLGMPFSLYAGDGDDTIIISVRCNISGGKGNDVFDNKGTESITYSFSVGDGNDKIVFDNEKILSIAVSTIEFEGRYSLELYRYNSCDLMIKYSENDFVLLDNFFNRYRYIKTDNKYGYYHPANIINNGGVYFTLKDQLKVVPEYGTQNRTFYFEHGQDTNIIYSGDGEDTLIFNNYAIPSCCKFGDDLCIDECDNKGIHRVILKDYFVISHSVKYMEYRNPKDGAVYLKRIVDFPLEWSDISQPKNMNIYGNSDNNNYEISILSALYTIQDDGGKDTLKIENQAISDFKMFFNLCNVSKDGNFYECGNDLYFVSDYNALKSSRTLSNDIYEITEGIKITNYFTTNGKIEKITDKNGTLLKESNIESIAQSVASWLTSNGREYSDVYSVLQKGNTTEINELLSYFSDFQKV